MPVPYPPFVWHDINNAPFPPGGAPPGNMYFPPVEWYQASQNQQNVAMQQYSAGMQQYSAGMQQAAAELGRVSAPRPLTFRINDEVDVAFYERVYGGARFRVGDVCLHSSYIVTPGQCSEDDLGAIRYIRAVGLGSDNYHPGLTIEPPRPRRRAKLPREPVEALPLPG
jgi:hypothetical protein